MPTAQIEAQMLFQVLWEEDVRSLTTKAVHSYSMFHTIAELAERLPSRSADSGGSRIT